GLRATLFQNLGPGTVFEYAEGQPRSEETLQDSLRFGSGEIISSYHSLEPRLSLKVQLDPASSVKAGFHRSAQFINQVSNTASVTPVDVWLLSNRHILPQRADNFSLGYYRLFEGGNWESSLELYYRRIENVLEYKDLAELLANEHLETELLQGEGRSYGVEFSLKRRVGRWNGWLGYTYSRSLRRVAGPTPEETINRGEWFPSNFDKPHDLSLVLSYQVSRRLNISANFTYSTGRPITAPVGRFSSDNVINIPVFSERNQQRVPDYHRLDLSLTLDPGHKKGKKWRSSFTLSVYNLYARRNAYSVFFTQAPFARPMARRLAVLGTAFPALTYNFHWQ
ncbi:MAG: TonB-dependent receptor, partial [Bacteroidetes bacterium]